jgi:hypothetical protein
MTLEELAQRLDDLVAAVERIADVLEDVNNREKGELRIGTRER